LVFAVFGNGGVGKSTLARVLYNDEIIAKHFSARVWIYASVDLDETN
jgi:adenylate kinase family enzyme